MFTEDDLLPISGLQHLAFCERQWMLIHLEGEWSENVRTVEGKQLHEHVHEQGAETREGVRLVRGLRLRSLSLGIYGVADLVEFHSSECGAALYGMRGTYIPYPVEYKRGRKRYDHADEMQLCAQAVCLEEMFGVSVPMGAIYYGQPRRRCEVEISASLRNELEALCLRNHALFDLEGEPGRNVGGHCKSCSLVDLCMPGVISSDKSGRYIADLFRLAANPSKEA